MSKQSHAYLYAVSAVLLWSTVATAFKIVLRWLDPVSMLLWSSLASLIVLFVTLVIQGKLSLLKKMTSGDWGRSLIMGLLNPFAYYMVLFEAYRLLPAQQAQPLNYTWPIVLVLLSIPVLKQKIGWRSIAACIVAFAGVIVISTEGKITTLEIDNPTGVALAIGSSVLWASYWLLNMRDKRDEVVKLFAGFLFGFVAILGTALIMGRVEPPTLKAVMGATYVGLFEMGFTFLLWIRALKLSKTTAQVSILIFFSPFISLLWIYLILGESILTATVIGLVLIVAGVVMQQFGEMKKKS